MLLNVIKFIITHCVTAGRVSGRLPEGNDHCHDAARMFKSRGAKHMLNKNRRKSRKRTTYRTLPTTSTYLSTSFEVNQRSTGNA
jgi:hypothetical protein